MSLATGLSCKISTTSSTLTCSLSRVGWAQQAQASTKTTRRSMLIWVCSLRTWHSGTWCSTWETTSTKCSLIHSSSTRMESRWVRSGVLKRRARSLRWMAASRLRGCHRYWPMYSRSKVNKVRTSAIKKRNETTRRNLTCSSPSMSGSQDRRKGRG